MYPDRLGFGGSDGPRRRRRHAVPISLRREVYDWTALSLLLAAPLVGPFLFGAVRPWSVYPLMFLGFLGAAMCFARPLLAPDLRRLQPPPGGVAWLVFLVYAAVRLPWAAVPYEARIEVLRVGSAVAAYWAWTELASRYRRWRVLLGLALFAVTLIAWYAIIQHAHGSRMVLNLERPLTYGMRASGTYFCPNHFAALMGVLLPVALALVFTPSAGIPLRLLAGYALALFLPVTYLTQSRSGWIGAAAGMSVTLLLLARRKSRKLFYILVVALPVALAVVVGALWTWSPMVRERLTGSLLSSPDSAVKARLLMWPDVWQMIRARPVLGWGPGSFQWTYPPFKTHPSQNLFDFAHNEYLHVWSDYGAVGLLLFAAWMAAACWRFLRVSQRGERDRDAHLAAGVMGAVAAALAHAVFDFNLHIYSVVSVLLLVAGVAAAALYGSEDLKPVPLRPPRHALAAGGGVAVLLLLAAATAQAFVSYGLHFLGEERRVQFEMPAAESLQRAAVRLDPGNWRPYLGWGHIYQTQGFWDFDQDVKRARSEEALELYRKAGARNPYDKEVLVGMAKAWNTLGEQEKALECLRAAVGQDRYHLFYVTQLGLQLRRMGRHAEALEVFEQALQIDDTDMVNLNIRYLREKLAETPAE